jgi:chromate reductase
MDRYFPIAYMTPATAKGVRMVSASGKKFNLLGLSGSIRRDSHSKALLQTIKENLPDDIELNIFGLETMPPYNEDLDNDQDAPPPARALKRAVTEADGIIAVTPEYNHGMSGILKNAVDWVSRPGYESVLKDKPVAVMTVSSSPRGGVRAQAQMHDTFLSTVSRITPGRQVAIGSPAKKIANGRVTDENTLLILMRAVDVLIDEICMVQGRPPHVDPAAEARKKAGKVRSD